MGRPKFAAVSLRLADALALIALRTKRGVNLLLTEILPLTRDSPDVVLELLGVLPELLDRESGLTRTQTEEAKAQLLEHVSCVCNVFVSLLSPQRGKHIVNSLGVWQQVLHLSLARLHAENVLVPCLQLAGSLPVILPEIASLIGGALQVKNAKTPESTQVVLMFLIALTPVFQANARPQGAQGQSSGNQEEVCRAIGQLCCEFCEVEIEFLVAGSAEALQLRDLLLLCANQSDLGLVEDTLEIFSLVNDLEMTQRSAPFRQPLFNSALQLCLQAARFPTRFTGWEKSCPGFYFDEDQDGFVRFRENMADTLITCWAVLQGTYFEIISQALRTQLEWNVAESLLFAVKVVAGEVRDRGVKVYEAPLQSVLSFITREATHPTLLSTTCSLIGAYGFWLCERPELPAIVHHLLSLAARTEAAAQAFLRLSIDLQKHSPSPQLVSMVVGFLCSDAVTRVSPSSRRTLMSATSSLLLTLFRTDPNNQGSFVTQAFGLLVQPIGVQLQSTIDQPESEVLLKASREQIELLIALYSGPPVSFPHPGLAALTKVQGLVAECVQRRPRLSSVAGELYENILSCFKLQAQPMLNQMITVTVQAFAMFPSVGVLSLMIRSVELFGNASSAGSFQQAIIILTQALPKDDPEVEEAFFRLCSETYKRCPDALQPVLEPAVSRIADSILHFSGRGSVRAGCAFLDSLFGLRVDVTPQIRQLTLTKGPQLVQAVVHGLAGGAVPRDLLSKLATLLLSILRLQEQAALLWVQLSLGDRKSVV